jgi:hypothetical protein
MEFVGFPQQCQQRWKHPINRSWKFIHCLAGFFPRNASWTDRQKITMTTDQFDARRGQRFDQDLGAILGKAISGGNLTTPRSTVPVKLMGEDRPTAKICK